MSNISKRRKDGSRAKIKSMGDHDEFLKRITKTLYYGQLPSLACLSLPVTEISCSLWSVPQRGRSLRRLHADAAARVARAAYVSPCALVLAVLYLERLQACNPDYLAATSPSDLFLVSLMVSSKFLQDDGEAEEPACAWAAAGRLAPAALRRLEADFLNAIEWNVFVSERAFAGGLARLERAVALRQAGLRGFFTYTDLAASCDHQLLYEAARAVLTSLASLVAVVASALLVTQACLPLLKQLATSSDVLAPLAPLSDIPLPTETFNVTLDEFELDEPKAMTCCTEWLKYEDTVEEKKRWYDSMVVNLMEAHEPKADVPLLAWLYQRSLVDPAQRWLEMVTSFSMKSLDVSEPQPDCTDYSVRGEQCVKSRLNFSKLGALMVSLSD